MTGASPRVSVVVPTRDRPASLAACLAALDEQTESDLEVVVVDDASEDAAAVAAVVAAAARARLVVGEGRGPAAARNLGGRAARGRILCFTDDDCRPVPGWLEAIVRRVDARTPVVAGPTINGRPADPFATASQTVTNHLVEASLDPISGRVGFVPTSNVACAAEVHREHPFDESFPLAAGEDREWCDRLAAAGIPIVFEPAAGVRHHPTLSWAGFWRQQVRYGRGAHRYHGTDRAGRRLASPGFYAALVRKGLAQGWRPGALVVAAQVATAVGFVRQARASR